MEGERYGAGATQSQLVEQSRDLTLRRANRRSQLKEHAIQGILIACSFVAIFTTIGIVASLAFEAVRFFSKIPLSNFLFGLEWSPQTAIREGQVGSSGKFGILPLLTGTLLISFIAMVVATPLGLLSAVYLAEFAKSRTRNVVKPMLELLAGIPTVVYGFFAALFVAPMIKAMGSGAGFEISSESALAAGLVMGIMLVPYISSLSDDVINAVPQAMRDASYGMGATHTETVTKVVLPAAVPGIIGSLLLAISRAIGETMIVVMAAGQSANLSLNPFEAVTTMTVQIVTLLTGDSEFDSAKTLAAFAIALFLLILTLGLNIVALRVVDKYKQKYA